MIILNNKKPNTVKAKYTYLHARIRKEQPPIHIEHHNIDNNSTNNGKVVR